MRRAPRWLIEPPGFRIVREGQVDNINHIQATIIGESGEPFLELGIEAHDEGLTGGRAGLGRRLDAPGIVGGARSTSPGLLTGLLRRFPRHGFRAFLDRIQWSDRELCRGPTTSRELDRDVVWCRPRAAGQVLCHASSAAKRLRTIGSEA